MQEITQNLWQHLANKTKNNLRKALFGGLAFLGISSEAQAQQFGPAQINPFGLRPAIVPVPDTTQREAVRPAVVDIDGDGDLDVFVTASQDSALHFLQNTGTATAPQFAAPVRNPFSMQHDSSIITGVTFGDLDGDGDQDMMSVMIAPFLYNGTTISYAQIAHHPNRGTANAPVFDTTIMLIPVGGSLPHVQLLDYDGDGDLDVAYIGNDIAGANTFIYINTGTATAPSFSNSNPINLTSLASSGGWGVGDLDRDGDLDVLVGQYYGNFHFLPDTSTTAGFQLGAPVVNVGGLTAIEFSSAPALGDFDGDGDLDVLAGHMFYGSYGSSLGLRYFPNTFCDSRSLTIVTSDRNDPNQPNGVATVTVTGGTLPFVTVLNNNMPINRLTTTFDVSGLAEGTYTLRLTDSAQCKVQGTFTINRNIVSVEQLNQASLVLMPNPTSGTLFIQAPSALAEVRVLTLDGRLVQQWFHLQTNQLELGDLPNGLYLLQARTQDGQMFTEKFSKQ